MVTKRPLVRQRRPIDTLPVSRIDVPRDRQDLIFPRGDVIRAGLSQIRSLRCTAITDADALVHNVWHELWDAPDWSNPKVAQIVKELGSRHKDELCSCVTGIRVRVNALTMINAADTNLPDCMIWEFDQAALDFTRQFVRPSAKKRIGDHLTEKFIERHIRGRCSCSVR